jgi:hypothetical protein
MILGIDIGSRSIEVVGLCGGDVVEKRQAPTTFDPVAQLRTLLDGLEGRLVVATGYGRKLVQDRATTTTPKLPTQRFILLARGVAPGLPTRPGYRRSGQTPRLAAFLHVPFPSPRSQMRTAQPL